MCSSDLPLLVFHMVFGKSVPDISLNAVANLGDAECHFLLPVYPGDTLRLQHTLVDKQPMRNHPTVGKVRTIWEMFNQHGDQVLHMEGWAMFRRRTPASDADTA